MSNLIGQSFGRYHILEQLGEGGMATVYKAYDTRLETDVAVKVIRTENLAPSILERALKRFEREAKALARLTHSNIVKVLDYGEQDGKPYLVMPFLQGGTLKEKLRGKPMSWRDAARLLIPITRALAYAHRQSMVHRDVKPANILITEAGDPMLTDFGIAKIIDEEATMDLTGTSAAVGTPEYMAPEQVTSKNVDHRADVYALGIVLYEMVTGRKPFQADTPMAVLFKHASEPLPRPKQFAPGIPDSVEHILLKALAKNPADRYQGMDDFSVALEGCVGEVGINEGKRKVKGRETTRSRKRSWLLWAGGALMAVLLLLGGIFLGGRGFDFDVEEPTRAVASPTARFATVTARPSNTPEAVMVPSITDDGCADPLGCVVLEAGDPIHIAYLLVVEGPDETLGIDSRNGVEIAIDAVGGQILGHDIHFDGLDGGCNIEGGSAAAGELIADPSIVAIIGSSCSSEARGAMPILSRAGYVMISPSNTLPDLTEVGNSNHHPGYLRTSSSDKYQGIAVAQFVYEEMGLRSAATIHDGSIYADILTLAFAEEFEKLGGRITTRRTVDSVQTEMGSLLTGIAAGDPDLIYFPIFVTAGGSIISQARTTPGLEGALLIGSDGLFTSDLLDNTGSAIEGFMVSSPDFSLVNPEYSQKFLPAYRSKFGTEPISIHHAHAYDAFMMIKAAVEKVAKLDADGGLYIGRQALREALYSTRDFIGLTGTLSCSPTGDCSDPKTAIYEYHTGQYPPEKIWP